MIAGGWGAPKSHARRPVVTRASEACAGPASSPLTNPHAREAPHVPPASIAHLTLARRPPRFAARAARAPCEYVALILLVALVMAGVVAAMKGFRTDEGKELGDVILGKIKQAVRRVQF